MLLVGYGLVEQKSALARLHAMIIVARESTEFSWHRNEQTCSDQTSA